VTPTGEITYRDLRTLDELRRVVELERIIWEYTHAEDVVPVPILAINVKRGGILVGAFDASDVIVGFAYSLPGLRDGRLVQWSHMLGVLDAYRNVGLGRALKLEQRQRALAMDVEIIEWTFDPMQAMNAHLNLSKLGAVVEEYAVNIYGESSSALHRGTPTDRFVAVWRLASSRVTDRLAGRPADGPPDAASIAEIPRINETQMVGEWLACGTWNAALEESRLRVEIPAGFTEMQQSSPDAARAWRMASRDIFTTYLPRGYRVTEFVLDRDAGRGSYILER
jgi:predicted GNAT superfamily acetyltransferase|tara:strand:- start:8593 stop:9435 length:843 start_codon:yes stop_codon:yes gene_type:complete